MCFDVAFRKPWPPLQLPPQAIHLNYNHRHHKPLTTTTRLYAVGGRDGSSSLSSVECYDPHTNKWELRCPMNKRRGGVGVAVCNDFLYVIGGHDAPSSNPASSRFDCVERLDYVCCFWGIIDFIDLFVLKYFLMSSSNF